MALSVAVIADRVFFDNNAIVGLLVCVLRMRERRVRKFLANDEKIFLLVRKYLDLS